MKQTTMTVMVIPNVSGMRIPILTSWITSEFVAFTKDSEESEDHLVDMTAYQMELRSRNASQRKLFQAAMLMVLPSE